MTRTGFALPRAPAMAAPRPISYVSGHVPLARTDDLISLYAIERPRICAGAGPERGCRSEQNRAGTEPARTG